jgi:hypothetical protein
MNQGRAHQIVKPNRARLAEASTGTANFGCSDGHWGACLDATGGPEHRESWVKTIQDTAKCFGFAPVEISIEFEEQTFNGAALTSAEIEIEIEDADEETFERFMDCLMDGWAVAHGERLVS